LIDFYNWNPHIVVTELKTTHVGGLMKCVICDNCPVCVWIDGEHDCNLDYSVSEDRLYPDNDYHAYSTDCGLSSIVSKEGLFQPEWIETAVVMRDREEPKYKLNPEFLDAFYLGHAAINEWSKGETSE
jgi:hypothetical protein